MAWRMLGGDGVVKGKECMSEKKGEGKKRRE
jgi:hypothetical protein